MNDLSEEDAKLLALAKQARARVEAAEGAAVRDDTGRSYSGATVELPSANFTALQLAVAQAVAAGARDIEAAVVVTHANNADGQPVADASSTPTPLFTCSVKGEVVTSTIVES